MTGHIRRRGLPLPLHRETRPSHHSSTHSHGYSQRGGQAAGRSAAGKEPSACHTALTRTESERASDGWVRERVQLCGDGVILVGGVDAGREGGAGGHSWRQRANRGRWPSRCLRARDHVCVCVCVYKENLHYAMFSVTQTPRGHTPRQCCGLCFGMHSLRDRVAFSHCHCFAGRG